MDSDDEGLTCENVEKILDAREDTQHGEQFHVKFKGARRLGSALETAAMRMRGLS